MITINYKLDKGIFARTAAQLNWELNAYNSSIEIINAEDRKINGKSLIGLLSGNFKEGQNIKILINKIDELDKIKKTFNKVGKEILTN